MYPTLHRRIKRRFIYDIPIPVQLSYTPVERRPSRNLRHRLQLLCRSLYPFRPTLLRPTEHDRHIQTDMQRPDSRVILYPFHEHRYFCYLHHHTTILSIRSITLKIWKATCGTIALPPAFMDSVRHLPGQFCPIDRVTHHLHHKPGIEMGSFARRP